MEKPAKIVLALRLLYMVIGIGVLRTATTVIRHADVRSPQDLIIVKMIIYTTAVIIIYQVGKGKNWARWALLGILAISLPLIILPGIAAFSHNPVLSILEFLQLTVSLVAFWLLFHGSTRDFFGK